MILTVEHALAYSPAFSHNTPCLPPKSPTCSSPLTVSYLSAVPFPIRRHDIPCKCYCAESRDSYGVTIQAVSIVTGLILVVSGVTGRHVASMCWIQDSKHFINLLVCFLSLIVGRRGNSSSCGLLSSTSCRASCWCPWRTV